MAVLEKLTPTLDMHAVRINAVCFAIAGVVLYLMNHLLNDNHLESPLGYEGIDGIYVAIGGGVAGYYFCRYRFLPPLRIAFMSVAVFFAWFFGFFVLTNLVWNLDGPLDAGHVLLLWISTLTALWFLMLGTLNGVFGYWISLFNIINAALLLLAGGDVDLLVWASLLGIVGIDNVWLQWATVALSTVLGFYEQGVRIVTAAE